MRWMLVAVAVLGAALTACAKADPHPLDELVVVDSLYMEPATGEPFTGPVVRYFTEAPDLVQLEGRLLNGTWDGELLVYHPNGRIRYMGSFREGERCGPWTNNADSTDTGSVYEALIREVETMGLYPPCDGDGTESMEDR